MAVDVPEVCEPLSSVIKQGKGSRKFQFYSYLLRSSDTALDAYQYLTWGTIMGMALLYVVSRTFWGN